jgi:hypothetical protein
MFKKGILTLFVVLVGLFAVGAVHAAQIDSLASSAETALPPTQVYVNPGGLGDVLIYGYYNVRDNHATYFTVTNTSTEYGARVRIRFREAANVDDCNGSVEVLDFDICLSPGDMWGGVIYTDSEGYARLESWDTDTYVITSDSSTGVIFPTAYPNGVQFKTVLGNTIDQTREGYFEIIAERQLTEVSADGTCGPTLLDVSGSDVDNVLMGHAYIINEGTGASYPYVATALADFAWGDITSGIGTVRPNLRDDSEDGTIRPVNYALTKAAVGTVYVNEPGQKTSLIITFPTKWATHTCTSTTDDIFDDPRVLVTVWDDAEHSPETVCEFSPCPSGTDNELPYEVNVIDIDNKGIFTSDVETVIDSPYDFGWIMIDFTQAATSAPSPAHATSYGSFTSSGLPAIGYVVHDIDSGVTTGMLPLQYGSNVVLTGGG